MHMHEFDEFYFVLDGKVTVRTGDRTFIGTPGSFFFFPRGVAHSGTDASETDDGFRMLVMYAPRFGDGMDKMLDALGALNPQDPNVADQAGEIVKTIGKTTRLPS